MKYLWLLILPLLLVGCFRVVIYDPEDIKDYVGVSASGTTGTVEYSCQRMVNNPSEVPIVCYFKNISTKPKESAVIRIGWYSNTTGEELLHTDWGGRGDLKPGETQKYYFSYPVVDLQLQCGYNLDRCTMLVDKKY